MDNEFIGCDCKLCTEFRKSKYIPYTRPMIKQYAEPAATIKASNPKDAIGSSKVPLSTIPAPVLGEIGLGMLEGACKYGRHNYREIGVRASVYYDAVFRHMAAWYEGQDIDPDSGLSHLSKAMASLVVLRDAEMNFKLYDDRPPQHLNQNWVQDQNAKAKEIIAKYPNPKEPYIRKDYNNTQSYNIGKSSINGN